MWRVKHGLLWGLVLLLLSVTGCSRGKAVPSPDQETSAASTPISEPLLAFDHLHHDASVLRRGKQRLLVSHSYPFTNRTSQPVQITKDRVGCRQCVFLEYPTGPIPPQGKAEVRMIVDLEGRPGPFRMPVFLYLQDDDANVIDLSFSCFVLEPVLVSPDPLEFGKIVAGTPGSQILTLRVPLAPHEKQAEVLECAGRGSEIQYRLGAFQDFEVESPSATQGKSGEQQVSYRVSQAEVEVTINPKVPGKQITDELLIRIKDRPEPVRVQVRARVGHPRLAVRPWAVNFGPIGPDGVKRKVTLRGVSGGAPPVEAVTDPGPGSGLRAWLEPNPEDNRELFLWVEAKPDAARFVEETLILKVKDPQFPEHAVPYIGYVVK